MMGADQSSVAVATMTWARDEAEADLLFRSLRRLSRAGLPVFAADGGSPAPFLENVQALPGLVLLRHEPRPGPRLLPQVQAALAAAAEQAPAYVLYTEPDKHNFFERGLAEFLAQAARHPGAGLLIPARDAASFATFPAGQQLTERLSNELTAAMLGVAGDYLYGPLLIRRDLVPAVLQVREDIGWGWRLFAAATAVRRGLPVVFWPAALPCPEEQRGEDDLRSRIYRMEQLAQGVKGLALGLKVELTG